MKINRYGQAKILSSEEMDLLFKEGFKCARDRALFGICRYTACRFSEARQMLYVDAFTNDVVRPKILLRRRNTKGKMGTREVDTHPNLAKLLETYRKESILLLQLYDELGKWHYLGPQETTINTNCRRCGSSGTIKDGINRVRKTIRQRYKCKDCKFSFELVDLLNFHQENQVGLNCDSQIAELGVKSSSAYGFLFLDKKNPFLFPGKGGQEFMSYPVPQAIFSEACKRVGITGASTHSFRRTALTELHNQGVPLKVIQKISGHKKLHTLQRYLETSDEQICTAINSLGYSISREADRNEN